MKKIIILTLFLLLPSLAFAQNALVDDQIFKAKVLEVIEEKEVIGIDGATFTQQNLKLIGLEGDFKDTEFIYTGITDLEVVAKNVYSKADKVIVNYSQDFEGNDLYYILDYVRTSKLYLLLIIFVISVVTIGKWKGFKSLIALAISFIIILKFIIPKILSGSNPLIISVIGGTVILLFAVYLTQGFSKKAHLANLALTISFVFTALLSVIFTNITKLTGLVSEEAVYIVGLNQGGINMKGLLLAGILIGALGVLDDIIINQVSAVEQIKKANPGLSDKEVYKRGLKIGVDHISSMTNTLFFAYVGVSLPLLILFSLKQPPFLTFSQVINNEVVATEIVRALVGSVGLVFSIPIANYLASYFFKVRKEE